MTATVIRTTAHALLFVLAVAVFYLGLGIGLQFNPFLGTVLWILAGTIAALNIAWILRRRS